MNKRHHTFEAIFNRRYSRRWILQTGTASLAIGCGQAAREQKMQTIGNGSVEKVVGAFQFEGLPAVLDTEHHVAKGHSVQILIRWGDPLFPNVAPFDVSTMDAQEQEVRFGYGNDYIALFSLDDDRLLMVVNHESTAAGLMFEGEQGYAAQRIENIKIEQAAHGLTVAELVRVSNGWSVDLNSPYNRRITAHTPIQLSGPVAGHTRVKTAADPVGKIVLGTLGNCAGGVTPWGTVLTCEENINHYFRGEVTDPVEQKTQRRMKIPNPNGYEWYREDARFNSQLHPTEPNRFGWVVELNPFEPESIPKKRTALGRFFHESANPVINADGRVVIYMGDDTAYEHLYRFVSTDAYVPGESERNKDLLDSGELSAAQFDDEGGLRWIVLKQGVGALVAENGFHSQVDVLIDARRAAHLMGATPMDRPEDVEVSHHGDTVYVCLTKNRTRGIGDKPKPDSANPRSENRCGHIIEIKPPKVNGVAQHHAERMDWDILLLGGRPEDGCDYGEHHDGKTYLGCPDNACLDPQGRLWVTTDGSENSVGCADGIYAVETGDQRGRITRLFASPIGAEVTGPCFTADGTALFASVQHPGLVSGFDGAQPVTRWPDFEPTQPARPAVIVIQKESGGALG